MNYTRSYAMDGMCNLRDLGGYAADEGVTRYGVMFRGDLPQRLSVEDKARFKSLGVRHTLDLRNTDESETMLDELSRLDGVSYRQIPMLNVPRAVARTRPGGINAFDAEYFWGDEYIRMLESNHPWTCSCMEYLAEAEGPVLFHCFTGKDRTGILSMLVLGLCGVSENDIAADYSVSQIYLRPLYRRMRENFADFASRPETLPFYSTAAENILAVYNHVRTTYGSVPAFLHECGVTEQTVNAIREKLIEKK